MKVNGVYVKDYMKLDVMQHEIPNEPGPNEVLVKTMACGVCCWDSWLYRGVNAPGPYPYVIGHEGAGIVEKVGSEVDNLKPGDKVFAAYGGNDMMSEYFINRKDGVVKLSDEVKDWASVIYEPACCVINVVNSLDIQLGDHVVLVGAGYMGLQTLQVLTKGSQAGRITVFELRDDRRRMAEAMNPTEVADPESEEGKKLIEDIIKAGGADVVIDFGATTSGFELADSLTKQAGKLGIATFHRGDVTFNGTKWHLGGLKVYNLSPFSNAHYPELLPKAYEMIRKRVLAPEEYVTHTAYYKDLEAMENLFQRACDKEDNYMKGVVYKGMKREGTI